ncbi:cation:proton antiporter [Minwuia thermotolerans]|uniref:Sodium:proton antiporter n=1 Tax=Minwuia thermotolerans TaxID=2056226 RepID=A0A2M9FZP2_9PROT|nr:cation:proton antiporter [Minwuia thermotolerans]PJK28909.1 sodium:proton antiporter [Minwuia thermotolerans]
MHEGIWTTILGLFGLMTIAVLILPVAKRYKFPYTVLLAVVGIILGLLISAAHDAHLGPVSDLLHSFESFDLTSEIIIFVFLPALVFESSLSIDVRKLMADIRPILFLAVIGLLISAFMVGGAVYAVSGMGFVVCLLLGAILSATDPVAVVAIFKDLGAPKRLAILVEGESLFNDATAIVLFNILVAMILGAAEADLIGGAFGFLQVFVGGIVVGYLMARGFAWVIGHVGGIALVEVTLTISLAYLSFLVAEHYLHVSGVMAVVTAALVMGSYGRTTISGHGWHLLQETWENLGFWANSLIFVLVGMAVPQILSVFTGGMWTTLVVLIATAFFARGLLTHAVLPVLSRSGIAANVSLGFRTVMWWGGLRGAVSLALALAVLENEAFPVDVRNFIAALVCAFVLFTLFVNATTVGAVMKAFGLDRLSPADLAVRNRTIARALDDISKAVPRWAERHNIPGEVGAQVAGDYARRVEEMNTAEGTAVELSDGDWLKIGLLATVGRERQGYLDHYSRGYVPSATARELVALTDELMDATKTGGVEGYRSAADKLLEFNWRFMLSMQVQRRFGMAGPLGKRLANRMERLRTVIAVLAEVRDQGIDDIRALVGDPAADRLCEILDERRETVMSALNALRVQYPDYAGKLQRRYLQQVAIRRERSDYARLHDEAIIGAEIYANLQQELEEREDELGQRPALDLGLDPEQLVAGVPLFQGLSQDRIQAIAALLKSELALPGENLCRKGETGDAMYFVSSGAIEVRVEPEPVMLGSGDFFGEIALLKDAPRTADVVAKTFSDLLILERRDFQKLLDANPDLRKTIETVAEERLSA